LSVSVYIAYTIVILDTQSHIMYRILYYIVAPTMILSAIQKVTKRIALST